MPFILQVDFPTTGPFGADMTVAFKGLAESIAAEDGLLWKIWTESAATGEAGGIYLFATAAAAEKYCAMHTARLQGFGVTGIRAKTFEVNEALSSITKFNASA